MLKIRGQVHRKKHDLEAADEKAHRQQHEAAVPERLAHRLARGLDECVRSCVLPLHQGRR
jgi:hypothetical protein